MYNTGRVSVQPVYNGHYHVLCIKFLVDDDNKSYYFGNGKSANLEGIKVLCFWTEMTGAFVPWENLQKGSFAEKKLSSKFLPSSSRREMSLIILDLLCQCDCFNAPFFPV